MKEQHSEPIILKTKIEVPLSKQNLVLREQLMKSISDGLTGKLTYVCASAGFGKSTLLSQWASNSEQLCAWVTLDPRDNDEVRFWRYVTHAIASALPDFERQRIVMLAGTLPSFSMVTFLDALINELCLVRSKVILILDDYHVIDQKSIHNSMTYLIDYLPDSLHVMIASRTALPFSTIKWKTKQESREITVDQLQFTLAEAEALYQKLPKSERAAQLSQPQVHQLVHLTEGWITGLQLVALSMREEESFDDFIENFKGNHYHVADYLFHEVIASLPPEITDFLLQTSVLSRFNSALCDVILQTEHSSSILEALRGSNLFIIPLDAQNTWFRYHHLFAQYLQEELKQRSPEQWVRINQLASTYFAEQNLLEEAIEHAHQADDFKLMESYLESYIPVLLHRGEFITLLHWYESFPEEYKLSVQLSLLYAFVLTVTGNHRQAAQIIEQLEQQYAGHNDLEDGKELQSGLLFVRSNLMFSSGDFAQWLNFIANMLDDILPENPTFYNFNYNVAEPFVRRTSLGLKGALSKDMERIGLLFTDVLEKHGWQDSLINLYVKQTLCEGYYEWNRITVCNELLPKLEQFAVRQHILGLLIPVRLTQAQLYLAREQFQLAHATIEETLEFVASSSYSGWTPILVAFKARIYLLEGKIAKAKQELAGLKLNSRDKPTLRREFEYITLIRLLGKQRKEVEAIRLLELLRPQAEREQLLSSIVEINILQALLEQQQGKQIKAIDYLQQALALAEKNSYIRSFLDEGARMKDLLTLYLSRKKLNTSLAEDGISVAYVQNLIQQFPSSHTPNQPKITVKLVEELSRGEVNLLRQIQQGATNKQIAEALALSEGTVKVYLSRLYDKLGVSSRTQALLIAQEANLLD